MLEIYRWKGHVINWFNIMLFVVGVVVVLLYPSKKKKVDKDTNIDWTGDDGTIASVKKQYPNIDLYKDDDFRYKIEPKEKK